MTAIPGYVAGMPGIRGRVNTGFRVVRRGGQLEAWFPGGRVIDGSKSRDSGNTGNLDVLRCGLLLGKITASGKYAPSILGNLTANAAGAATTVTVSAAQAVELVRRVGATGTLRLTGPPSAAGTVATFTETYSAVNTSTGDITTSALDAALVAGSFVQPNDGSETILGFVDQDNSGGGIKVTDGLGTSLDVPIPLFPISGEIQEDQLLNWPADTSLKAYIRAALKAVGLFTFSGHY